MALGGIFSYWMLPVVSGLVWLGMLLGMLIWWTVDQHRAKLPSMGSGQKVAYISDVGAFQLQPLFIAGCAVTTVFLDLSFAAERWLRHKGRLVPNMSRGEKVLAGLSILFALVGTAGLILLSIFDTYDYPTLHDLFLLFFMGGYLVSAVFTCWEYQRLGKKHRDHRNLRISFWLKLTFILVELALAAVFVATDFTSHTTIAAIFEWTVAFIFTFYILAFIIDLAPAALTRTPSRRFRKPDPRDNESFGGANTPPYGVPMTQNGSPMTQNGVPMAHNGHGW